MIFLLLKQLSKINKKSNVSNISISIFALMALIQILIESFGSASFNGPPGYFFAAVVNGLSIARYNFIERGEIYGKNKKYFNV